MDNYIFCAYIIKFLIVNIKADYEPHDLVFSPIYIPLIEHKDQSLRFEFTTCGMQGRSGPTQLMCDEAYAKNLPPISDEQLSRSTSASEESSRSANGDDELSRSANGGEAPNRGSNDNSGVSNKQSILKRSSGHVTILNGSTTRGFQMWVVPQTALFIVAAIGAAGGSGRFSRKGVGRGAFAAGVFNFTKGEKIFIVVGQRGTGACPHQKDKNINDECSLVGINRTTPFNSSLIGYEQTGGGGGGGASFVFKMDNSGGYVPLVVAGGGGGLSATPTNTVNPDAPLQNLTRKTDTKTLDISSYYGYGGTFFKSNYSNLMSGRSVEEGAEGGWDCQKNHVVDNWNSFGGFGGGAGGCYSGGNGGGFYANQFDSQDKVLRNGFGGTSFINKMATFPKYQKGGNNGDGEIEIEFYFECECEYKCVVNNMEKNDYICSCPVQKILAANGYSCIDSNNYLPNILNDYKPNILIFVVLFICIFFTIIIIIIIVAFIRVRKKKKVPTATLR